MGRGKTWGCRLPYGDSCGQRSGPRGAQGYVLGTDLSEGIVELARQVAREQGLEQIETRVMDGEKLDRPEGSFDAVLCRLGLMYMPNPVKALSEWRDETERALRPWSSGWAEMTDGPACPSLPRTGFYVTRAGRGDGLGLVFQRERELAGGAVLDGAQVFFVGEVVDVEAQGGGVGQLVGGEAIYDQGDSKGTNFAQSMARPIRHAQDRQAALPRTYSDRISVSSATSVVQSLGCEL